MEERMMMRYRFAIATAVLASVGARSARPQTAHESLVDVHGHKLYVDIRGTKKAGVPTVVFSSGLGAPSDSWNDLQTDLNGVTRTIAYDRAGTFGSGPAAEAPTMKEIVSDLHALLMTADARPPYVLVGWSYGGAIIHSFAALHANEVAGLVYVDPMDFYQTAEETRAALEKAGVKGGRAALTKFEEQAVANAASGIVDESREIDRAEARGFAEYRADGEAPDVPTVVLLSAKDQTQLGHLSFPGDFASYFHAVQDQRIAHFSRMVERLSNGTIVVTTHSDHQMLSNEPDLIAWNVRRVVTAASTSPYLDRLTGKYALSPSFAITISRVGQQVFLQATDQPKFLMTQESELAFSIKSVAARIEFEVDSTGSVSALTLVQNGVHQRASRAQMNVVER